jgi:hypothetical protein
MFTNMKSSISLNDFEKSRIREFVKNLDESSFPSTYDYCANNPFYRKSLDILKEQYLANSPVSKNTFIKIVK